MRSWIRINLVWDAIKNAEKLAATGLGEVGLIETTDHWLTVRPSDNDATGRKHK